MKVKMKVKELNGDWKAIHFADTTIIKADLKYMSAQQREHLDNIYVVQDIAKGHYSAR